MNLQDFNIIFKKFVVYYGGEKPEGGNYQFVLDAVYAAQKAGKKYCVGENLS